MSMTADELNRKLAEALGGVYHPTDLGLWMPKGVEDEWLDFNPAYHVDDLRDYVLPEIKRRGRSESFTSGLVTRIGWPISGSHASWELDIMVLLETAPAVLAEAALKALEEEG